VQEFLAACIFVFVKHPYDVGDHVVLKERQLIVQDIYLTYTTFRRVENGVVIHIPHSEVRKECIENWSRTKELKEKYPLDVHCAHSINIDKINKDLESRIKKNENKLQIFRYLVPAICLETDLRGVTGQIKVQIEICHKERVCSMYS
jgi:small-conductance mechanosensitive channel